MGMVFNQLVTSILHEAIRMPKKTRLQNGKIAYVLDGYFHNEYGPAIIAPTYSAWYIQGMLHREDGPARIYRNDEDYGNNVEYWLDNEELTKEEFNQKVLNKKLTSGDDAVFNKDFLDEL